MSHAFSGKSDWEVTSVISLSHAFSGKNDYYVTSVIYLSHACSGKSDWYVTCITASVSITCLVGNMSQISHALYY